MNGLLATSQEPIQRNAADAQAHLHPIAAEFVSAVGKLDLELAMQHMSPDANVRAGAHIVVKGKQQVRRILVAVFASLNAIYYRPAAIWSKDGVSIIDADVAVEWENGAMFRLPLTTILRVRYDLIVDIHVYCYEPELPAYLAVSFDGPGRRPICA